MTNRNASQAVTVIPVETPSRLTTHPLAATIGALFVVAAIQAALSQESRETMGLLVTAAISASFGLGGLGILTGIFWRGDPRVARAIECSGYYISASVWAVNVALLALGPGVTTGLLQGSILLAGCLLRARTLRDVDRGVKAANRARSDPDEGGGS